jgi:hypothetical protein
MERNCDYGDGGGGGRGGDGGDADGNVKEIHYYLLRL